MTERPGPRARSDRAGLHDGRGPSAVAHTRRLQ